VIWEVKRWARTVHCRIMPDPGWSIEFQGWPQYEVGELYRITAYYSDDTRPEGYMSLLLQTWGFTSSRSRSRKMKEIADEWPRAMGSVVRGHPEVEVLIMEELL
jgi:hypothetical protein